MRLQVEQLDKETKDKNDRMRIIAKRLDHLERAYRKEERPLLAVDYEQQQIDDRKAFEALQKSQLQAARDSHKDNLETKARLARLVPDYKTKKDALLSRRGEEFAKRREEARQKAEEEKAKRRKTILKEREDERNRIEEEERLREEAEEEEKRLEEGQCFHVYCFLLLIFGRCRTSRRRAPPRGGRGGKDSSRGGKETRRGGQEDSGPKAARGGSRCRRREIAEDARARRGGGGPRRREGEATIRASPRPYFRSCSREYALETPHKWKRHTCIS